jgi:ADP-dependent NAD(P)H-hydrate dehydratase / NAD(P)H-hydrate epimerase
VGPLPHWCDQLPDAATMRGIDRWAIDERAIPSLELMERAGLGVAQIVEQLDPDGPLLVLCGKGNNGGDGLVVARLLRQAGRTVRVLCSCAPDELAGDARTNLERLPGEPPTQMLPSAAEGTTAGAAVDAGVSVALTEEIGRASIVLDALLGTGFDGVPHGVVGEAIELLNCASVPVVSVDVPSGVDASTGAVRGAAVRASVTASFQFAKPGLWINPGKAHTGAVRVLDIGIPRGAPVEAGVGLIGEAVLQELPRRRADSTKFKSGHVVIAGGSRGLSGAPRMAAQASMRTGAGYVTVCAPEALEAIVASGSLEVMTRGLPEQDGELTPEGVQTVLAATREGGALVLGPGLGRGNGAFGFARELALVAGVATVLDADGLNAHAGAPEQLAKRRGEHGMEPDERAVGGPAASRARMVLTPHAGELGRLLECDSQEIERERLAHVRTAAERTQAVVVLKGDDTLVADPGGLVAVSCGGSPALATAGTGDVLSGVIAALLAQGLDAFTAACAGVSLHAAAGRLAARKVGAAEGVIASDVIAALPLARIVGETP